MGKVNRGLERSSCPIKKFRFIKEHTDKSEGGVRCVCVGGGSGGSSVTGLYLRHFLLSLFHRKRKKNKSERLKKGVKSEQMEKKSQK